MVDIRKTKVISEFSFKSSSSTSVPYGHRIDLAANIKSAAALVKRKSRVSRRRNNVGDHCVKDVFQFTPVRRKPLGEYLMLEIPESSSASVVQGGMSYAAAVESAPPKKGCVKVVISPRVKKPIRPKKNQADKS